MDEELKKEISKINERLSALEKEIRYIREDILSEDPKQNMQRRMLHSKPETLYQRKEKIDDKIKIKI